MDTPKVTVLITAYNQPKYLNEAVESALNQKYHSLEVLVIDDGSNPPMDKFLKSIDNNLVKYIKMEHKGFPYALIKGCEEAKGDFIAILDHDDTLTPGSISKRVNAFQNGEGFVYGNINYMDKDGKIYSSQNYKEFESADDFVKELIVAPIKPIKHSSVMFDREKLMSVGNYDSKMLSLFDTDLIIRIALKFGYSHINDKVLNYRTHGENASRNIKHKLQGIQNMFEVIDRNYQSAPKKVLYKTQTVIYTLGKIVYHSVTFKKPQWLFGQEKKKETKKAYYIATDSPSKAF